MKCITCMKYNIHPKPETLVRYDNDIWMKCMDIKEVLEGVKEYMVHKQWCAIKLWDKAKAHHECTCDYEEIVMNITQFCRGTHTDLDKTCEIQYLRDK